jgi:hypothetical protein
MLVLDAARGSRWTLWTDADHVAGAAQWKLGCGMNKGQGPTPWHSYIAEETGNQ